MSQSYCWTLESCRHLNLSNYNKKGLAFLCEQFLSLYIMIPKNRSCMRDGIVISFKTMRASIQGS